MIQPKLKTYLEVATNIAVLLVALIILSDFAWTSLAKKTKPRLQDGLRRGDIFPTLSGIHYDQSSQTLIFALSSRCTHFQYP